MKLNLEAHLDPRNGYVNVSSVIPQELPEGVNFTPGRYDNLSEISKENETEEIIFANFLNVIDPIKLLEVFIHWNNILKSDGLLKIKYIDIRRLGRLAYSDHLALSDLHAFTLGGEYQYKAVLDTTNMKKALTECGYKINTISSDGFIVIIEAEKKCS